MSDLISREDAIKAIAVAVLDDRDELEAIKALPSAEGGDADMTVIPEGTGLMKPCPDNGADLISRADAIEAVDAVRELLSVEAHCAITERISALPSAEAVSREDYHNLLTASNDIDRALREYQAKEESESTEAVQGEWTNEDGKPITDKFSVYCSRCKEWSEYRTNYCGHCGADMRKEK